MEFAREHANIVLNEGLDLFFEHYKEISANLDIPLEPDNELYLASEENGSLRVFTVRDAGVLIGYSVFFISFHPHYKSSKQAAQDVIFIQKDKRGSGKEFIKWCDEQLKNDGVQVVYQHIKAAHDWSPVLERIGYKKMDLIYSKRLDK